MALVPSQVLRVAILLSYCSILCNYKAIEMPSHHTYGGSWKFLTFIDLVIQAVFFGICVLTDLSSLLTRGSGNQEQERQLKKLISLRDWMLAVLAFPVGVHTTVLPFILIEMRTSHHGYPSRSSGLTTICTFSLGYILCLHSRGLSCQHFYLSGLSCPEFWVTIPSFKPEGLKNILPTSPPQLCLIPSSSWSALEGPVSMERLASASPEIENEGQRSSSHTLHECSHNVSDLNRKGICV
ncbi:PREDICTED: androgen-induced gene 1 protein isoform X4 [Myotis davidii]|uniref:androgen-induced gene 1 protein isoform X4 n=1 Tax=Myotis davidii TaxID=225400 RepID=UPI00076786F4|nr:PREDICTED: androgen-induced gene 1 protein isoform X4 [Myotis davidii]